MQDTEGNNRDLFPDSRSPFFMIGTITYVDTKNCICHAVSDDGYRFPKNIQYLNISSDGVGEIHHPSAGDTWLIKQMPDGSSFLEEQYTVTQVDEQGKPTRNLGIYSKFMPGDRVWIAKGGSFLQLLRNGLTKIGVTPLCQMIFMKLESYTRWISRNIEILASGFRFYSVNQDGVNTTRLSLFLTDAMTANNRDDSSSSSDFEVQVAKSSLTIFFGPKDKDGNRINSGELSVETTGDIYIRHYDKSRPDSRTIIRRIKYTADGCSEDTIYGNSNDVLYSKKIVRLRAAIEEASSPYVPEKFITPLVSVSEQIAGDYQLKVDGNINITAGKNVSTNGNNVFVVAEINHAVECAGSSIQAGVLY